jgi:hypothetical protein
MNMLPLKIKELPKVSVNCIEIIKLLIYYDNIHSC